jgi:extradiol dioxygenase family protein
MKILHVAVPCRRVENADLFYGGLLGLIKSEPRSVPRELALTLFGLDQELTAIWMATRSR